MRYRLSFRIGDPVITQQDILDFLATRKATKSDVIKATGASYGRVSSLIHWLKKTGHPVRICEWHKSRNGQFLAVYALEEGNDVIRPDRVREFFAPLPITRPELWAIEKAFLYREKSTMPPSAAERN